MFPWYGYFGLILVVIGEFLIFKPIEPLSSYFFFIFLWFGYIFIVDAWVYHRSNTSRLKSNYTKFWMMFVISSFFWWFYELLNIFIENWRYESIARPEWLIFTIAFTTVLPAVLETSDLLQTTNFFSKRKWKITLSNRKLTFFIFLGILFLILPFVLPRYTFPLVWLSMWFLLDPINYLLKNKSVLGELKKGTSSLFWSLMVGALITGFFWEFWNFWAPGKWYYTLPFLGFFKIFEMPILGFLGYLPFGLSLYAMYQFVLSFKK
jgi:hypothetical protein